MLEGLCCLWEWGRFLCGAPHRSQKWAPDPIDPRNCAPSSVFPDPTDPRNCAPDPTDPRNCASGLLLLPPYSTSILLTPFLFPLKQLSRPKSRTSQICNLLYKNHMGRFDFYFFLSLNPDFYHVSNACLLKYVPVNFWTRGTQSWPGCP